MKRPATLLALLAIFLFASAGRVQAQFGGPPQPTRQQGSSKKKAPPPKPVAPPEPEPEPLLEPQAEPSEPAPSEPAPAGEPSVGAEAEVGEAAAELPARAAAPSVLVPRTICQGRRIKDIEVAGNGRVSGDDVRASMKLHPGLPCSDAEIARDARSLWDLGYFDDLIFSARLEDNELVLSIVVKERPAIGKINFEGDSKVDQDDIDEKVSLEVGAILSENDVRAQIPKIRDLYAEEGFFLAKVSYKLVALPNNQVEVRFDIVEGPQVSVRRIQFIGNDHLADSELLQFMRTHPTAFLSFLSSNDRFKRDFFDEDVLRIQALYYDRGYLNIQVLTPRVELTPDRQQIDVTIPIKEGSRFKIGRMRVVEQNVDGVEIEPLGGRRVVRDLVDAQPGEWFSRSKLSEGIEHITKHYRDDGFAKAEVAPETDLDAVKRSVDVNVVIRRGLECHIERIDIQGNDKTRDRVIRREVLIAEGDKYSQTLLGASKDRIQALGYFERVDMSEADGDTPGGLVITYEVKERATGTFQVGAGFSSIERFILTAQIDQQNLAGHGQSLSLQAQLSGIRQLIQSQFVEPYLLSTFWSLSVDVFHTSNSFQAYTTKQTGAGLALGHPVFGIRNLRMALRYSADRTTVGDTTTAFFSTGAQGRTQQQRSPLKNQQLSGRTSTFRLSLTWDSRDNRIFPTKGIYSSLTSEIADPVIGSQRTFQRHKAFARFYYPLPFGMVLRFNSEVGLVTSRKAVGVPLYERFFLGGILSVRGFPFQSLGPISDTPLSIDPNAISNSGGGLRLGGNAMIRTNLELEFPILAAVGIKGVIFTDSGTVWNLERTICQAKQNLNLDPSQKVCGFNPLRYSYGFGLRWFSPMGPLRFEWGFPFAKRSYEDRYNFQFTIGQFF
ncbi:MAG: outer membrane protein assembly factor YaeT precursor [Myxococcaceae bacterium]|nr:outer membrane protein assembly factor YaeT precursor [Myxococcaceae bacterium]